MDIRKSILVNGAAYGLALIGTIIGTAQEIMPLVYVCKPALMIILSSWFYFNSRRVGDRFTLLIQAGLFFSLIGDIALMFRHIDDFNFLIGLGAFLLAQLCYTMGFGQNIGSVEGTPFSFIPFLLAVIIAAYGYFFAARIVPTVEETIMVPVIIYAITICLMGIGAAFRFGRTFPRSFFLVFGGAILFIASDSMLAFDRFVHPFASAGWAVMLTYAIGQFAIAAGCLDHVLDPEEIRRRAALRT